MYKEIIEDRMTIYLEDDLIAPNVKGFNTSVSDYLLDLDILDEVVLNLGSVENIDSIGVTFVIGLYKSVTKDGLGFAISDASENVRQLFKLMKLEDLLE
ncbi:MAG: STAS domain-containing protein [Clostridiales bacterium]|nr:STAS domain-containing protein [Clostridiales bacterium]